MPGKNKYWYKAWNADPEAGVATHESGLQYRLGASGVVFLVPDKYADDYGAKIIAEMGIINASEHLAKLKRDAVKLLVKRVYKKQ
jgi:flagellar biosynthesis/type III secretory pathway protein FliH